MVDVMGFIHSAINTVKFARKSDRREFFLYMRLTLLGMTVIGTIGYVVQLIGSIFRLEG